MSTYSAILADPPWEFRVWGKDTGHGRSAKSHYPTMSLEALKALPIGDLAADDCALFMWTCWPVLPDALELGAAWGFQYKTCAFDWTKTRAKAHARFTFLDDTTNWHFGMGYWTRANTEPCLLFTRGNPERLARNVRQLIVSPVREHSRKPDDQYARIERLVCGPYLELFARHKRNGWQSWGNEIVSDIEIEAAV